MSTETAGGRRYRPSRPPPAPPRTSLPKQRRKRRHNAVTQSQRPASVGLNFGSSALSASCSFNGKKPESIPMGETRFTGGRRMDASKLPTNTMFPPHGTFQTLGHNSFNDSLELVSSGAKQSLDPKNLCPPGSEGEKFLNLCQTNSVDPHDVVTKLLSDALLHIESYLKKRLGKETLLATDWTVTAGVPAIWTCDDAGIEIQERYAQCLQNAGFPAGGIRFDEESGLTLAYIEQLELEEQERQKLEEFLRGGVADVGASTIDFAAWEAGQHQISGTVQPRGRILVADVGASTIDFTVREVGPKSALLVREPAGCGGGMSEVWSELLRICFLLDRSVTLFRDLQAYVYDLGEENGKEKFERPPLTISRTEIEELIRRCYEKSLTVFSNIIKTTPNIREIIISGEAPTSNRFIEKLWRDRIESTLREAGLRNCVTTFIKSETASLAVCMGAAIPYDEDPRSRFKRWSFGFKIHACSLKEKCNNDSQCKDASWYIQELKPRKSMKLTDWVPLNIGDLDEGLLTIEPHMVVTGKPFESLVEKDTGNQVWRHQHSVSMAPIRVTIHPNPRPTSDDLLEMRFRVVAQSFDVKPGEEFSPENPPRLIYEVRVSNSHRTRIASTIELGLCADRDRLYLSRLPLQVEDNSDRADQPNASVEAGNEKRQQNTTGSQLTPTNDSVWEVEETPPPPEQEGPLRTSRKRGRRNTKAGDKDSPRKSQRVQRDNRDTSVDLGSGGADTAVDAATEAGVTIADRSSNVSRRTEDEAEDAEVDVVRPSSGKGTSGSFYDTVTGKLKLRNFLTPA